MTGSLGHSPVGASGASRWMKCPGSVSLSQGVEDTESEHASLGTTAHALAAECLKTGMDAWQYTGVDADMANAVQVYLNAIRDSYPGFDQGNSWVERGFNCPGIHEFFYGTADFVYFDETGRTLHVWDYKHGVGVVVEVENNPQLKYYALGALIDLDLHTKVDTITLHVAQPRGFHFDGPIREWSLGAMDLIIWGAEELIPAMDRAINSTETASGEHCRFCPARGRACPQILADFDELEGLMKMAQEKGAPALTNEQVGRILDLHEVAKIVVKAARETGFERAQTGAMIPGWKLAKARSNREWKEGAQDEAKAEFGGDAFTVPELKSPAQIDELPKGKSFTSRHAHKPDGGLQLVPSSDSRQEAGPSVKSMFKAV